MRSTIICPTTLSRRTRSTTGCLRWATRGSRSSTRAGRSRWRPGPRRRPGRPRTSRTKRKRTTRKTTISTAATPRPTTRCACTCARWGRCRCSRARARSRSPSASRRASAASSRWCLNSSDRRRGDHRARQRASRAAKIRIKDVVRDVDEEDAEFNEQWHTERVCQAHRSKVKRATRKRQREARRGARGQGGRASSQEEEAARRRSRRTRKRCSTSSPSCASTRSRSRRSSGKLKTFVVRVEKARGRDRRGGRSKIGLSTQATCARRSVEMKQSAAEGAGNIDQEAGPHRPTSWTNAERGDHATAQKKIKRVEEEAKLVGR